MPLERHLCRTMVLIFRSNQQQIATKRCSAVGQNDHKAKKNNYLIISIQTAFLLVPRNCFLSPYEGQ